MDSFVPKANAADFNIDEMDKITGLSWNEIEKMDSIVNAKIPEPPTYSTSENYLTWFWLEAPSSLGSAAQAVLDPVSWTIDSLAEQFKKYAPDHASIIDTIANAAKKANPLPHAWSNLMKAGLDVVNNIKDIGSQSAQVNWYDPESTAAKAGVVTADIAPLVIPTWLWVKAWIKKIRPELVSVPEWLTKSESEAVKILSPKEYTPSELERLKLEGKVETGKGITWQGKTYIPSKEDIDVAKTASPYLKEWSPTTTNIQNLDKAIWDEAMMLESSLKNSKIIVPKKTVNSHVQSVVDEVMSNPEMVWDNKMIAQRLIEKYKAFLLAEKWNPLWILRARKNFDNYIRSVKPNSLWSTSWNVYDVTVKAVRNWSNDFLDKLFTNANKSVKDSLRKQRLLYQAREKLAPQKDISKIGKILKSPVTKIVVGTTALNKWIDLFSK